MADPDITKAKEKLKRISAHAEKLELARMREKAALDWNSSHANAREEGRQEGIEDGILKGQIQVLKNLLVTKGPQAFSLQELLSMTQLPKDTIQNVLDELYPNREF